MSLYVWKIRYSTTFVLNRGLATEAKGKTEQHTGYLLTSRSGIEDVQRTLLASVDNQTDVVLLSAEWHGAPIHRLKDTSCYDVGPSVRVGMLAGDALGGGF